MIIGVDAGALSIADARLKVGVWRISVNLLKHLAVLDRENIYRLYVFDPLDRNITKEFGSRMEERVLRPTTGWFRIRLPLELRLRPVDCFLGLSQALPSGAPKSIGFIYDLGFLHTPQSYPDSSDRLTRQTREVISRAGHIVTISQSARDDIMRTYGVDGSRVTAAYPGVDERFHPKGAGYRAKRPYFLSVGSVKRGKNIPLVLRSFAAFLRKTGKACDLLIAGGDYWEDPEVKKTIAFLGLAGRVELLGFVPDTDLPAYYRGAVALVSPSRWEGFCLPAAEAMASGCPVIASTAGALPEVVGDAGILVPPDDGEALTQALAAVASDRKRRERMIRAGLAKAKAYRWDTFARSVLRVIQHL
ncbi:glycosyltransferase family 4 protein [Patescibacteria group bacterium]|nr:glycosyltransferase family 4 protein [Patescibacteria group bacterium]